MNKLENKLKTLYYNAKVPGSFSGFNSFKKTVRDKKLKISDSQLKEWLAKQDTYTLHKPVKRTFQRNKTVVFGIDHIWQADLIDMSRLAKFNKNNKYLLSIIDVFSKFAWVKPLKNKTSISIIKAFKQIFKSRKPQKLHTDKGTEFLNGECRKFLKQNGVQLYTLNSEMKASIVERFNRTIKEKMWRYFSKTKSKNYLHVLDDLVSSYNNSYHRSIKTKPINVNEKNKDEIFQNLYGHSRDNLDLEQIKPLEINFKIGDKVRISKYKTIFEKGYTPNWTSEIFIIYKIVLRNEPVYILKDLNNEIIEGVFYNNELQKVEQDNFAIKTRSKK